MKRNWQATISSLDEMHGLLLLIRYRMDDITRNGLFGSCYA